MENTGTELNRSAVSIRRAAPSWQERNPRLVMTAGMVASDLLGLALAGGLAILMRWVLLRPFEPDLLVWFGPVAVLMVILFSLRHLYPGIGLGAVEEFQSLTIGISVMFIMVSTVSLALQEGEAMSRFVFVSFWMASMVCVPACRRLARHMMTLVNVWGEPMAIIGPEKAATRLFEYFKKDKKIGLKPLFIFVPMSEAREIRTKLPIYFRDNLEAVVEQNHIRTAAVLYEEMDEVEPIVNRYRETFERLVLFNVHGNHLYLNKVSVQHYGDLISLQVHHRLLDPSAQAIKRVMDTMIAGVLLVALLPFFLLVAVAIFIDSPGSILYRQIRLGKRGKLFNMYKFRTMYPNADAVLEAYFRQHPDAQEEWDRHQKLKKDPRITTVGRFLRRFSIDELAQLWNVLKGEMSLVGPRPILQNQEKLYGEHFQHYLRVTPGISGLWQINGRNQTTFARRAELDMEYVISWSGWLDIYIIIRTIWIVLRRDGAY